MSSRRIFFAEFQHFWLELPFEVLPYICSAKKFLDNIENENLF